jgi:hypothetical protein
MKPITRDECGDMIQVTDLPMHCNLYVTWRHYRNKNIIPSFSSGYFMKPYISLSSAAKDFQASTNHVSLSKLLYRKTVILR